MASTDLSIEPLSPSRRDDFLRFFDHERGVAFADNPQWAKCYCHYYHVPATIDWETFDAATNRIAMASRIEVGEMEGFLAYAADEVVGWINAQPLHKLRHCWERLGLEAPATSLPESSMAAIVCFVIAPAWRRRGVARALLQAALASFATRGLQRVYAFPFRREPGTQTPSAHYHGPEALFRECGFVETGSTPQMLVMIREP
ncbi:MAG TPA: GNAT family N-acetyltransferase [Casimicrobiaceae bacterium]|nr:GNAT family N-acetyltransferase [Casimicrobiaceae bacterium]